MLCLEYCSFICDISCHSSIIISNILEDSYVAYVPWKAPNVALTIRGNFDRPLNFRQIGDNCLRIRRLCILSQNNRKIWIATWDNRQVDGVIGFWFPPTASGKGSWMPSDYQWVGSNTSYERRRTTNVSFAANVQITQSIQNCIAKLAYSIARLTKTGERCR